jgi:hypothetical protein
LVASAVEVYAHGKVGGVVLVLEERLNPVHQEPARLLFAFGKVKVVVCVTLWNDQRAVLDANCVGLSRFREESSVRRRVAEGALGVVVNLRIGSIAINLAELGSHGRLERQSNVGLICGNAVLVVLSKAGATKVTADRKEGRSRGAQVLRYVHQHVRLLPLHEHVQDVVAQDGVKRALRAFRRMVRIVSLHVEAL